jgi:hypothetical protein
MKKLVVSFILGSLLVAACSFAKEFGVRYDNNTNDKKVLPIVVTYYLCTPASGQTTCDEASAMTTTASTNQLVSGGAPYTINAPQASASTLLVAKRVDVYQSVNSNTIVMSKEFAPNECSAYSYLDVADIAIDQDGLWTVEAIKCKSLGA